jgi:hypothetical protein
VLTAATFVGNARAMPSGGEVPMAVKSPISNDGKRPKAQAQASLRPRVAIEEARDPPENGVSSQRLAASFRSVVNEPKRPGATTDAAAGTAVVVSPA